MSQIVERTAAEVVALTASYMRRDKSTLIDLCARLGIPTEGKSKAALVAGIVGKSSRIEQDPDPGFNFDGLHLPRLNLTVIGTSERDK